MMKISEEYFDIFTEDMRALGKERRSAVHREGYWHQTFHCWIVRTGRASGTASVFFQLRSPEKDTHPNLLDISCAGHLAAGETEKDGVRELKEELGLDVPYERLTKLGTVKQDVRYKDLIDREFCHVYLYECDLFPESFRLQPEEVTALVEIPLEKAIALFKGDIPFTQAKGVGANGEAYGMTVSVKDFVPHPDEYYVRIFGEIVFCLAL